MFLEFFSVFLNFSFDVVKALFVYFSSVFAKCENFCFGKEVITNANQEEKCKNRSTVILGS